MPEPLEGEVLHLPHAFPGEADAFPDFLQAHIPGFTQTEIKPEDIPLPWSQPAQQELDVLPPPVFEAGAFGVFRVPVFCPVRSRSNSSSKGSSR